MRKTFIGIIMMAVAIMMTLSGAVFAAGTVSASASNNNHVGDTVTVTLTHPSTTSAYEYTVTYDPTALEYTGSDTASNGKIKVANMDLDQKEIGSHQLTFKALKEGTTNVAVENPILADTNGQEIEAVSGSATSVEVKAAEKTTEPTAEPTKTTTTSNTATPTQTQDTKKGIKNGAKLGFDVMYIAYAVLAVLVAAGIVTVAKRK